jgi:hypothetical protein
LTEGDVPDTTDVPLEWRDQAGEIGSHFGMSAMWLSSWDAFHRGVPSLRAQGKYAFLPERESLDQLVTAPFDYRFLRRWTTWVDVAQTALVTMLVVRDREPGVERHRFRARDAGFGLSLSMNAAVGEEAWFRGYLLPLLYQNMGRRFWLANATQAIVFAAGHRPDVATRAAYFAGWAYWEGWIVKRNEWSVRESIFHYFWYDFALTAAAYLVEERAEVRLSFPTIRF